MLDVFKLKEDVGANKLTVTVLENELKIEAYFSDDKVVHSKIVLLFPVKDTLQEFVTWVIKGELKENEKQKS